jgi:hypothetical protein
MTRKVMFAGADGVYWYGLSLVCPLITPGCAVAVGEDIFLGYCESDGFVVLYIIIFHPSLLRCGLGRMRSSFLFG